MMIRKEAGLPAQSADPSLSKDDERYIGIAELREIIPVSSMTIWRWQRDPEVEFPPPVKLGKNGRNYWWLPGIKEWEARRPGGRAA
jgi:predicted DNA-binding transcriptional regulator AlpA